MVLSAKQLSGFESVRYQFVYVDSDVLSPSSWNLRDTNSSSPHRSGWYICLLQIIGMFFCWTVMLMIGEEQTSRQRKSLPAIRQKPSRQEQPTSNVGQKAVREYRLIWPGDKSGLR